MSLKVLLVVCALACAVSADVLVDDFTFTSPLISLAPSAPTFNSVRGTNIIGGERDVFISGQSSGCSSAYPEATVDGKLEAFLLSNPSSARTTCQASATSQYDGNDNSRNLQMGLNLNLASATGVEVIVANDDFSGIRYSLKFYSSASRVCTNTFEHVGRGSTNPDTRTFPISAFRGNCDLSNIGAIEVVLVGGLDIDQNIQYFKILQPSAGQVTVTVFDDCDCSGSRDNGEALRSSIQVNVAGKGNCNSFSTTANTNSNGVVTFGNLVGGCQYTFSVNQQTCSRSASSQTVSVVAGQARAVNFALFCPPQVGDVRGVVFSDCNCNGEQESGDNGVPSVTVTVTPSSSACSSATSTRTNSNGQFSFTGLRACTYTVSVNSPTCGSQSTSKSINLVSGTTSTLVFSTSGETCTIVPPNAVSVKCGDSTKESNTGSPTITGNCKAVVSDSAAKQVCDANVCGFASSFTRTWTISSQCTGTRSVTQTISIGACAPGKCPACDNSSPPDNNGNSPVAPASPRGPISPVIVGRRGSITCRRVCSNSDSSSSSDSSTAATVVMSLSLAIVALLAALLL